MTSSPATAPSSRPWRAVTLGRSPVLPSRPVVTLLLSASRRFAMPTTPRLARRALSVARGVRARAHAARCSPTSASPQRAYPAIHVVGTNGKTSTTLMTAALLRAAGLRVGAYISPHVRGWSERIQVDGDDADLAAALARVRPPRGAARRSSRSSPRPRSPSSPPGRSTSPSSRPGSAAAYDATNVLEAARRRAHERRARAHRACSATTREAIAAEKLAVVSPGATVVLGEPEWETARRGRPAPPASTAGASSNLALAVAAAEALPRQPRRPARRRRASRSRAGSSGAPNVRSRSGTVRTTSPGSATCSPRLPARRYTIVASILADKDADGDARARSPPSARPSSRPRSGEPARAPGRGARRSRGSLLRDVSRRSPTRRRARPRPRARRAGRCGARDRIAVPARRALARWLEPVHVSGT